jgi:hypothetical protein
MDVMVEMTHDEVQNNLCYALICETMEGSRWNSGRRRRLYSQTFTRSEQQRISHTNLLPTSGIWYPAYLTRFA